MFAKASADCKVVLFVSDKTTVKSGLLEEFTLSNPGAQIHTINTNPSPPTEHEGFLRALAAANGGTYNSVATTPTSS